MTGQSRVAALRQDSESLVNGPAGGPEPPPRLDVSGNDRSQPFARYSESDEDDEEDDQEEPGLISPPRTSTESQIIRCYRCEAISEFSPENPLQVPPLLPCIRIPG